MKKTIFLLSLSFMVLVYGCKKEILPSITNSDVISLSPTTAIIGVVIDSESESSVFSRGICWSTNPIPTKDDSVVYVRQKIQDFKVTLTGLLPDTEYYVRAFATSGTGTGYGEVVSFKTKSYGNVTDIDGNIYKTVNIGTQVWMAENLRTIKYRNGNPIGTTNPIDLDISDQNTPKYQWDNYNGTETDVLTYGRLYTWHTVADIRGVCPTGWHVPTDLELEVLSTFLGGTNVAGGKLKEAGTTHWNYHDTPATNESGFTALPGTDRDIFGNFVSNGSSAKFWTIKEYYEMWIANQPRAFYWSLSTDNFLSSGYTNKSNGLSVRCIKD